MTHIARFGRDQLLLLPEAVDDYVGPDNPVRFIDAFVDGFDLATSVLIQHGARDLPEAHERGLEEVAQTSFLPAGTL